MDNMTLLRTLDEICYGVGNDTYIEGITWPLPLPGVRARASKFPIMRMNVVGLAAFTAANVDEGIQHVIKRYQQEEKPFSWVVGPTSQPAHLGERLIAAGLTRADDKSMWGMVLRDLNVPIPVNPAIRVQQVTIEEYETHIPMMVQAFGSGTTEEVFRMAISGHKTRGDRCKCYLAYVPDNEEAVAFSMSISMNDRRIVSLGGAATLPAHRGKGIYSSMVAKRLEDARAMGATHAIINAMKTTSAPICAKIGFEIACGIDIYLHM
jgi:hypothetical protein